MNRMFSEDIVTIRRFLISRKLKITSNKMSMAGIFDFFAKIMQKKHLEFRFSSANLENVFLKLPVKFSPIEKKIYNLIC